MSMTTTGRLALLLSGALALAGCADGAGSGLFGGGDRGGATRAAGSQAVERDVEAPEIFQQTALGLWDGRPSLGGVWVAHPDVAEPERVIIRTGDNSSFVIGALFRRERELSGPPFQISSDAAEALGLLAGQPARINVTALRRDAGGSAAAEAATPVDTAPAAPATVETTALPPVAAPSAAPAAPKPAPAPALEKPLIQIGIFSIETNARNTATALAGQNIAASVRTQSLQGKTYWRVVAGPAATRDERATLLDKVKAMGFSDAYFVAD
ncbi:MAG: SPOR domain-containing protein [Tranquillimonas sp.]